MNPTRENSLRTQPPCWPWWTASVASCWTSITRRAPASRWCAPSTGCPRTRCPTSSSGATKTARSRSGTPLSGKGQLARVLLSDNTKNASWKMQATFRYDFCCMAGWLLLEKLAVLFKLLKFSLGGIVLFLKNMAEYKLQTASLSRQKIRTFLQKAAFKIDFWQKPLTLRLS